jgi:hypothetical protein
MGAVHHKQSSVQTAWLLASCSTGLHRFVRQAGACSNFGFVSCLQALMYPLLVACKSQSTSRRAAAMAVVDNVRLHSATLVQQAQLVRSSVCH